MPSNLFYGAAKKLTRAEIPGFAQEVMEPLYKDAESAGLDMIGPPEFIYLNASDDMTKPFDLVVGIPIREPKPTQGDFLYWQAMPFACVSSDYKGPMVNIGNAWKELVQQTLAMGCQLSNQGRKVYKEWVSFESEDNITELQMGIVARRVHSD